MAHFWGEILPNASIFGTFGHATQAFRGVIKNGIFTVRLIVRAYQPPLTVNLTVKRPFFTTPLYKIVK